MSKKHNYSKYYTTEGDVTEPETVTTATSAADEYTVEASMNDNIEPDVTTADVQEQEPDVAPDAVAGVVSNCNKLNVRSEPSLAASVLCVLDGGDKVTVALNTAPAGWYHVTTAAGVNGWCMSKYVDTCL